MPEARALPAPPSTVLPVPANESLPADPPLSTAAKSLITRPKTALPACATEDVEAPRARSVRAKGAMYALRSGDNPDDEGLEEAIQAVNAMSGSPPRPNSNGSEMEEDKVKEKKGKKSSSIARSPLVKATPEAAPRARPMDSRLNQEQVKAKQVDEPNGGYREAVEKILAEIPPGARRYARNSLSVNLDKDAYKCLAFPRWLDGAVAIALLSLLDPSPDTQVFFIDTITDPETGLLVKDEPKTIPIDGQVTTAIFAHRSNEHWVAIAMDMSAEDGPYYASWYCSFGRLFDEDVMEFYCKLVDRSLRSTRALSDEFTGEWICKNGSCARQPEGDSNSCGIYTLYNITRLVDGLVPSSDDELDPERQRWLFAHQISEYVTTHDPVPSALNSPLLAPINTLTLTNHPSSTEGEGNDVKGKGKMVLEEESRSPADSDPFVGGAMDIDEPFDIGEPLDKDSEAPIFPASPTSPSPMPVTERKDRLVTGFAMKGRGVKRSEATRSDEEVMEVEAVSKRRKQSSTASSGPTKASVLTTTDQTPPRATPQGFTSINQSSLPRSTGLTADPVQREAPSPALPHVPLTQPRPPLSSSSSSAHPTIHPNPPSVSRSEVDPAVQEEKLRKMNEEVLSEGAHEALRDLLQWYYKNQRAGVDSVTDVTRNAISICRLGPSTVFNTTPSSFKEASRLVSHDIGSSLLSEFIRRYHLAVYTIQYGHRKKALDEHFCRHPVPYKSRPQLVVEALLKETVFDTYQAMQRQAYRGSVWAGIMERFGFPFLAVVDLNAPRRM